jgi:hypothetical protein
MSVLALARVAASLGRVASNLAIHNHQMETTATTVVFKRLPRTVSVITTRQPNGVSLTLTGPGAEAAAKQVQARLAAQAAKDAQRVMGDA